MTRHFYKHKILLDENLPYRFYFPTLNSLFDVKHITEDYNQIGLKDPEVYKFAVKSKRVLITSNIKHFSKLAETSKKTGVIGISGNLPIPITDKKLTALFRKASQKSLFGKLTVITGETIIK